MARIGRDRCKCSDDSRTWLRHELSAAPGADSRSALFSHDRVTMNDARSFQTITGRFGRLNPRQTGCVCAEQCSSALEAAAVIR